MRLRTPVLAAATAGVLGGLVVGGSVLTGVTAQPVGSASGRSVPAAAPDDADDGTGDSEGLERRCRPHGLRGPGGPTDGLAGKLSGELPEKLVEDLSRVRELPTGEERREALEEIWDAALAGEYGEQVQQLAERRQEHRAEGRAGRHGGPAGGPGGGMAGRLGALRDQLPDELRADLQELRGLSPEERREALRRIWEAAKDGDYGAEAQELAQELAQQLGERRDDFLDRLPAELRADLEELRGLGPEERREALRRIWEAAKDGDYGAEAQELAEKLAERRAEHRQHRQERCGGTGGTEAPEDSSASPSTT